MALKELEVRYAAKRSRDHKLSDGEGLHLLVRPHGAKLWRLKYRFDGREKLLSFGAILKSASPRRGCAAPKPRLRSPRVPNMSWRSRPSKVARNIFARRV